MITEQKEFISFVTIPLKSVRYGDFFRRMINGKPSKTVYIRGQYDRYTKRFEAFRFDDANTSINLRGSVPVFIQFEF